MRWLHFLAFASVLPGHVKSQGLSDFFEPAVLDSLRAQGLEQMDTCPEASIMEKRQIDDSRVTPGNLICVGLAVVTNALPGGLIHDRLLNLDAARLVRDVNNAAAPIRRAFNFLTSFIRQNAWAMQIPESLEEPLAVLAVSWAADIVYGEKAAKVSDMPTATETQASSTSSGCPQPTQLVCGVEGEACPLTFKAKDGDEQKAVCAEGDHQDCECSAGIQSFVNEASLLRLAFLSRVGKQLSLASRKSPECPIDLTDFPAELFHSDKNQIYKHYCESWAKDSAHNMTVKSNGDNTAIEPHLRKRTPPASTKAYTNWVSKMSFTPTSTNAECDYSCDEAFQKLREGCTSNSGGSTMYKTGSLDAQCGVFSYTLEDQTYQVPSDAKIDCGGSGNCGGPLLKKDHCTHAMDTLRGQIPSKESFTYSTEKNRLNGNCWADIAGSGCGVFVEGVNGKQCSASGEKMRTMYEGVRKKCDKCGKLEYEKDCFFKIDFVSGCNNHG